MCIIQWSVDKHNSISFSFMSVIEDKYVIQKIWIVVLTLHMSYPGKDVWFAGLQQNVDAPIYFLSFYVEYHIANIPKFYVVRY